VQDTNGNSKTDARSKTVLKSPLQALARLTTGRQPREASGPACG